MEKELLFNNSKEVKDYLKANFEVKDVIKVRSGNAEELIGIILENFMLQVIWDDYSDSYDLDTGCFDSWIWDFEDIDSDFTYLTIEQIN